MINFSPTSTLHLHPGQTLRKGPIGSTILSTVPLLKRILPPTLLATDERKFHCRAILALPDGSQTLGCAIHEIVRFGGPA